MTYKNENFQTECMAQKCLFLNGKAITQQLFYYSVGHWNEGARSAPEILVQENSL